MIAEKKTIYNYAKNQLKFFSRIYIAHNLVYFTNFRVAKQTKGNKVLSTDPFDDFD